jgi:hypothetical protein
MSAGNTSNTIYYGISNGKIVRQFANPTPNSVERLNKNLRRVHEEFYDYLDGLLTDVYFRENEFGKNWIVILVDEKTQARQQLQFGFSSGYALGFLKALPNVDVQRSLKIVPSAKKEGDKLKTTVFVKQNNTTLKWFYTKEHPNGLPPLKKMRVKGKDIWDDSSVMDFLEKMVRQQIMPQILKHSARQIARDAAIDSESGLPF